MLELKQHRQNAGLSQRALADLAGVPRRTIENIERTGDCRLSTAAKIAAAMGVRIDDLWGSKMKKYFCETNGYNTLIYVADDGRAVAFDCETLDDAQAMDTTGADGFDSIDELAMNCNKSVDDIFQFSAADFEKITEIA